MLRAIVIDDEEAGIEMVKILTLRNSELIKLVGATLAPEEGITLIEDYKPDVVFLDISMPTLSGFDLLSQLTFRHFKLVFTTAHPQHALEAIKNKASDYLLKPIDTNEFRKCVEEISREREALPDAKMPNMPFIELQVHDGIIYIRQNEIIRIEASRSYCIFHLDNGLKHMVSRSLLEFEGKLDPTVFYRCHKSHIINLKKVEKFINYQGFFAVMSGGSIVDISKNNKTEFLAFLKRV